MEKPSKQILGVILIFAGLALTVLGVKLLFGPDQYAATAKVKMEIDSPTTYLYDPYFIQTTFEIISSHLVLSNVVVGLDLNNKWGKRMADGSALTTQQSMAIIQQHLKLAPVSGTKLITITYYSRDPNEAAQIANAIAKSYGNYRSEMRTRYETSGLKVLQEEFEAQSKQILMLQTNTAKLRQQFGIQGDAATNQLPEQEPFWESKRRLETVGIRTTMLKKKIEADQEEFLGTRNSPLIQITDPAEPAKVPFSPNRTLGAVETALGLLLLCGGVFLLKPARD